MGLEGEREARNQDRERVRSSEADMPARGMRHSERQKLRVSVSPTIQSELGNPQRQPNSAVQTLGSQLPDLGLLRAVGRALLIISSQCGPDLNLSFMSPHCPCHPLPLI